MIISQHGNFTIIVTQTPHKVNEQIKTQVEEKKDGEAEAKKEG